MPSVKQPLRIAIVVPGRFHAFDLAKALLKRGHEVVVFTNYPRWAVRRFGLPGASVRSFWIHGVLSRIVRRICDIFSAEYPDSWLNPWFTRWAASQIRRERWDVLHPFSGVAEEILSQASGCSGKTFLMRGSAHIALQTMLLREEAARSQTRVALPSPWIQQRELREYGLAETITVLSNFARDSFLTAGVPEKKLALLPLGVELSAFRATKDQVAARCERILSGGAIRVLYVGNISFQKGLLDFKRIVELLGTERFTFRMVGGVTEEARPLVRRLSGTIEFTGHQPQASLPTFYAWSDVFLFPTIQDGFPVVLAQALAGAVPVLTSENCSGPDLVGDGRFGWALPARNPELFAERLEWCHAHRTLFSDIVRRTASEYTNRDWTLVAEDFEKLCSR